MVKKIKNRNSGSESELQVPKENGKRPGGPVEEVEKKRIKTKSLYRQPTVRELTRLNETETLFNSNLFRLQIEEILSEVKVKEKTEQRFQEWYTSFQNHMNQIPENNQEFDLSENTLFKKLKVKSPISQAYNKSKCMFTFHKFNEINIIGSYSTKTGINSKLTIDILITVPSEVYTKNDSINYRYHKKRAAYLACIASHLKAFENVEELKYCIVTDDSCPILEIKPAGKLGNHVSIKLHLSCDSEAYKLHRFSPTRNNLRENWLLDTQEVSDQGPPTPYYNSSVLSHLTEKENREYLNNLLNDRDNLRNAIILLKIWLRQRKIEVSGFVVSMFVAYLVDLKRINNIMSSYQIVRNVWIAWKTFKWDEEGITLSKADNTPPISEFTKHFPVVFLDVTGYYNLTWQMTKGTYDMLKRESEIAIDMLDSANINSFIPLFMTPVNSLECFDHVLKFQDTQSVIESIYNKSSIDTKLNYGIDKIKLAVNTIHSILSKGLGERVYLVKELWNGQISWDLKEKIDLVLDNSNNCNKLSFGIVLNPAKATNIVDKGPPANLPEAEEFRAFWGEKSELRRFQDSSIMEACVWEANSMAERRMVVKQIVQYLLKYKFGIEPQYYIGDHFDSVVTRKLYLSPEGVVGSTEEFSLKVIQAFDELRKDLRGLTELPLEVASVHGISPVLSYCDPLPPTTMHVHPSPWRRSNTTLVKDSKNQQGLHTTPPFVPVCEAVVELTHSGKWPSHIDAFRCLKAAFHLQISERITKQYSIPSQAYPEHVDVLKNGFIFRIKITHSKELVLLKREVDNGVVKHRENEDSLNLLCYSVLMPKLRGALHGLHQKHPSYGATVCLAKRWLSNHLLDNTHVPNTVVELLCAYLYTNAEPYTPPSVPSLGLVRFWRLLAGLDWKSQMLLVDFNGDVTAEEKLELEKKFAEREPGSMPALFLATSYDEDTPSVWTERAPSVQVLMRARMLAKNALSYVEKKIDDFEDNLLGAFVPSLSGYDVIIHLHQHLVPNTAERIDKMPKLNKYQEVENSDYVPVVEFNVVEKYLRDLREAYSDFALFFHDSYGGDVIAVLWKPDIDELRDFQVATCKALVKTESKNEIKFKVNKQALIEDFKITGSGLVKEVVVCT